MFCIVASCINNYGSMLCIHIAHSYQASIIILCGSMLCIRHQYGCASCIMAQCCASCIHYDSILPNNLHHVSIWLSTVHHASKLWLNHVHHGSMLCIHGSIRHQYGSLRASGINMAQCCASMAPSDISMAHCVHQVSIMAQCCASGINVAVHHASIL